MAEVESRQTFYAINCCCVRIRRGLLVPDSFHGAAASEAQGIWPLLVDSLEINICRRHVQEVLECLCSVSINPIITCLDGSISEMGREKGDLTRSMFAINKAGSASLLTPLCSFQALT